MADRHRIRKPIIPPGTQLLSEAERQEQLDMLCPPPRAPMPEPLTIDQLRAYLERREREASEEWERAFIEAKARYARTGEHYRWDQCTMAEARRRSVCRELLDAIETGVLPE